MDHAGETLTGFVPHVPDQGGCGSCYAVGATGMMSSRLMIKYPELQKEWSKSGTRISWQQHLDHNPYNQGCDGGYPYLILKWGFENDMVSDSCKPLQKRGGLRNASGAKDEFGQGCDNRKFRVRNFHYLGGSFGRCGMYHLCEQVIREELYKSGPVSIAIEPDPMWYAYKGGILHELPEYKQTSPMEAAPLDDKDCEDTQCFIWHKIDHAVLLVGWGEEPEQTSCISVSSKPEAWKSCQELSTEAACKEKSEECEWGPFPYWILQNSYGPGWGSNGYLLVGPRGQNPMQSEAIATGADMEMVDDGHGEGVNNLGSVDDVPVKKQPGRGARTKRLSRKKGVNVIRPDAEMA